MLLPASRPPIGSRLALDACLDFDFARMRGQVAGVGVSLESIIVEARSGPALTAGPGGFFRTKAAGVPRFAHRWNGAGRGLQIERLARRAVKQQNAGFFVLGRMQPHRPAIERDAACSIRRKWRKEREYREDTNNGERLFHTTNL